MDKKNSDGVFRGQYRVTEALLDLAVSTRQFGKVHEKLLSIQLNLLSNP